MGGAGEVLPVGSGLANGTAGLFSAPDFIFKKRSIDSNKRVCYDVRNIKAKTEKRNSTYQEDFREKMAGENLYRTDVEAVSESRTEQRIPVGSVGVPPLSQEAISERSRIDREQRNLNLGGNTDM